MTVLHAAPIICLGQRSCLSWRALHELQRGKKGEGGGKKERDEKKEGEMGKEKKEVEREGKKERRREK